eukprot:gene3860-2738_t
MVSPSCCRGSLLFPFLKVRIIYLCVIAPAVSLSYAQDDDNSSVFFSFCVHSFLRFDLLPLQDKRESTCGISPTNVAGLAMTFFSYDKRPPAVAYREEVQRGFGFQPKAIDKRQLTTTARGHSCLDFYLGRDVSPHQGAPITIHSMIYPFGVEDEGRYPGKHQSQLEDPQHNMKCHGMSLDTLEQRHDYIQLLFPLRTMGMNSDAPLLDEEQAYWMRKSPVVMHRMWMALEMMMHFYGVELCMSLEEDSTGTSSISVGEEVLRVLPTPQEHPESTLPRTAATLTDGEDPRYISRYTSVLLPVAEGQAVPWNEGDDKSWVLVRVNVKGWSDKQFREDRQWNLVDNPHNCLRITRILQFLGEMHLEDLKMALIVFLAQEIARGGILDGCRRSLEDFWVDTLFHSDDRKFVRKILVKSHSEEEEKEKCCVLRLPCTVLENRTVAPSVEPIAKNVWCISFHSFSHGMSPFLKTKASWHGGRLARASLSGGDVGVVGCYLLLYLIFEYVIVVWDVHCRMMSDKRKKKKRKCVNREGEKDRGVTLASLIFDLFVKKYVIGINSPANHSHSTSSSVGLTLLLRMDSSSQPPGIYGMPSASFTTFVASTDLHDAYLSFDPVAFTVVLSLPTSHRYASRAQEKENLFGTEITETDNADNCCTHALKFTCQLFCCGEPLTPPIVYQDLDSIFREDILDSTKCNKLLAISVDIGQPVTLPIRLADVPQDAEVECLVERRPRRVLYSGGRRMDISDTIVWRTAFRVFEETNESWRRTVGPLCYPLRRCSPEEAELEMGRRVERGLRSYRDLVLRDQYEGQVAAVPWLDALAESHLQRERPVEALRLYRAGAQAMHDTGTEREGQEDEGCFLWVFHSVPPSPPHPILLLPGAVAFLGSSEDMVERAWRAQVSTESSWEGATLGGSDPCMMGKAADSFNTYLDYGISAVSSSLSSAVVYRSGSSGGLQGFGGALWRVGGRNSSAAVSMSSENNILHKSLGISAPASPFGSVPLNLYEAQAAVLSSSIYMMLSDAKVQPGPRERQRLEELAAVPPIPLLVSVSYATLDTGPGDDWMPSFPSAAAVWMRADDVALLWRFAHYICHRAKYFVPFLRSVRWIASIPSIPGKLSGSGGASGAPPHRGDGTGFLQQQQQQHAAERIMNAWTSISLADIFACLSPAFQQVSVVRRFALVHLDAHLQSISPQAQGLSSPVWGGDNSLARAVRVGVGRGAADVPTSLWNLYALPLVHAVRYDSYTFQELASFLLQRCCPAEKAAVEAASSWPLCCTVYWAASVEGALDGDKSRRDVTRAAATSSPAPPLSPPVSRFFQSLRAGLSRYAPHLLDRLITQEALVAALKKLSQRLTAHGGDRTSRIERGKRKLEQGAYGLAEIFAATASDAPRSSAKSLHRLGGGISSGLAAVVDKVRVTFHEDVLEECRQYHEHRAKRRRRRLQQFGVEQEEGEGDPLPVTTPTDNSASTAAPVAGQAEEEEDSRAGSSNPKRSEQGLVVTLPSHPERPLAGVRAEDFYMFKSAKMPLRITFVEKPIEGDPQTEMAEGDSSSPEGGRTRGSSHPRLSNSLSSPGGTLTAMFKTEDDIRQDAFVMTLLRIMDHLLLQQGLDLHLTPYRVCPTNPTDGLLEMVPDVVTFESVKKDVVGYWRRFHTTPSQLEAAKQCYIQSLAGYSVVTFILGVGDRHLENILLASDGRLVHIDFGFLFGHDPKPFPPPMKLCKEMIAALGGPESTGFHRFKTYCCSAYNILRQHAALLLYVMAAFSDADKMPQITSREPLPGGAAVSQCVAVRGGVLQLPTNEFRCKPAESLLKVQGRLRLDLTNTQATQFMLTTIADSVGSLFAHLWDAIHTAAQAARD